MIETTSTDAIWRIVFGKHIDSEVSLHDLYVIAWDLQGAIDIASAWYLEHPGGESDPPKPVIIGVNMVAGFVVLAKD